MDSAQKAFSIVIAELVASGTFPIAIGGGHDMAYAHYMGIKHALKQKTASRVGVINFDAHFDLRYVSDQPNSGTPFYQILAQTLEDKVDYFAIGIQQQSNTKELFDIAKSYGVNYALNYHSVADSECVKELKKKLQPIINSNDHLYITINLDGFSSAYAPGVSAPSPMGFTPYFVLKMLN